MRALVVGWSSVLHGEATAGDVLSMQAVAGALAAHRIEHELAWSAVMCPPGGLRLDDADPSRYTHLLWVCGPLTGAAPAALHARFAHCRRIAVGVSLVDANAATVTGFHHVIARDGPDTTPQRDLAARVPQPGVPVIGVYLTEGQAEYGERRRHGEVSARVQECLAQWDIAGIELGTRLNPRDWRMPSTSAQVESLLRRVDVVVTMRLHGLVLALKNGIPAVALDPVARGGKVSAQARAWAWPAVVGEERIDDGELRRQLRWCLSPAGRAAAAAARAQAHTAGQGQLDRLLVALHQ